MSALGASAAFRPSLSCGAYGRSLSRSCGLRAADVAGAWAQGAPRSFALRASTPVFAALHRPLLRQLQASPAFSAPRRGAASASTLQAAEPQALQPELQPGGGAVLAELSERAGFLPRPEAFDERLKPGFRGGRALLVFFLCNAVPFTALLYYLREQRAQRAELSMMGLPSSADDVAAEALRVVRTAAACFLVQLPRDGTALCQTLRVDPHPPEGTAYLPPTEPLPLLPQLERNVLTDLLESPPTNGLGFIHFAVSRNSGPAAALLAGDRRASLLYVSNVRGAYCTVVGQLSVLADPESRRRYWKTAWDYCFIPPEAPRPSTLPTASPAAAAPAPVELPPPWTNQDYLLVRLAVSELSLQPVVDGPQRWEQKRVRRTEAVISDPERPKWAFVAAEGAQA